jgi:fucose permease
VSFAVLADVHRDRRNIAINESAAINHGLAILAPLLTSFCIYLSFGWRSAILVGAAFGVVVLLAFRNVPLPEAAPGARADGGLSSVYWAYWSAMSFAVAIEFCILLWAPEFLERIIRLTPAKAAAAASVFVLAMFMGRVGGSWLARTIRAERLLPAQLALTLVGFLVYWSFNEPAIAILGLFVLGLGVSILYPLTVGLAIGAAGVKSDAASARATIAFGVALLLLPPLLGGLADQVGLRSAHGLVPILVVGVFFAFLAGRWLQQNRPEY